MVRDIAVI